MTRANIIKACKEAFKACSGKAAFAVFTVLVVTPCAALDLSYNPETDIVLAEQTHTGISVMVAALESNITSRLNAPSTQFTSPTRFTLDTDDQETDSPIAGNDSPTSIRLGVIGEEGAKGWSLKPAIELNEPKVFKDVREAVQWADDKNQPKTEVTPIDKTLEKLGISHYQINLQAEYVF